MTLRQFFRRDGLVADAGLLGLEHGVVAAAATCCAGSAGSGWPLLLRRLLRRARQMPRVSQACSGPKPGPEAPAPAGGRPGPAPKLSPLPQIRPGPVMEKSLMSSPQSSELCQWLWP